MRKQGHEAVAIFLAPGMNVAGRAQKLRGKVKALDGVLEVDINYVLNTVSIKYDSDKVKLPKTRTMMNTR